MPGAGVSWRRIILFILALAAGTAAFLFGKEPPSDAALVIGTTMLSIFAGFAAASMMLEMNAFERNAWRFFELYRKVFEARLIRQKWLLAVYMAAAFLGFLAAAFPHPLLGRAFNGACVFSLALSFSVPGAITRRKLEKYDCLIDQKRRQAGIRP